MNRATEFAAMPYGLYISAEGAFAQTKRIEALANNLANVDTTGFSAIWRSFRPVIRKMSSVADASPGSHSLDDMGGGVTVRETKTDFTPGAMKRTGIPTDMAVDGDGFFMVRRPDGDCSPAPAIS